MKKTLEFTQNILSGKSSEISPDMKRRDVMKLAGLAITPFIPKIAIASTGLNMSSEATNVTKRMPVKGTMDELTELGVSEAATAIRNGDISSELYSTALLKQARINADLNAFITIDEAMVLESAIAADKARASGAVAPLLGVPIGIKDSYFTKGLSTTFGLSNLKGFIPNKDAGSVDAIKKAGGIIFGKNNLVEMSYGLTGNNSTFGQVKNPHNKSHVTGGSSSGSGASVAARLVPASLGGDTIGSIRVPASLCGVVGFKPTTGRWPRDGVAPISHTLDTTGVFARNVDDCILIDQVVTGALITKRFDQHSLKGVKLSYAPKQYLDLVDSEVEKTFRETMQLLKEAGAEIVEIDLGKDFSSLSIGTTMNIFFRETKDAVEGFLLNNNVPINFNDLYNGLKPDLKNVWGNFVLPTGAGYISQETYEKDLNVVRLEIKRRFDEAFMRSGAQALILPTTPCTAPLIERQENFLLNGKEVSYMVLANNTIPTSAAGLPGISIPIGLSSNKLPIGMEIDGPHGQDISLLIIARKIEAVVGKLS